MEVLLREYLPILIFLGLAFAIGMRHRGRLVPRRAPESRIPRSCRPMNAASSRSTTRAASSTCASIWSRSCSSSSISKSPSCFPWAVSLGRYRRLRLLVDDGVPRRADGRLHLRMDEGSAGMGVIQPMPTAAFPGRRARTCCCGALTEELAGQGLCRRPARQAGELGAHRLAVADDLRPGLLRRRDDAHRDEPLRSRPLRRRVPAEPAPVRRDDRRRHAVQQDGAGAAQGLRPDGRAALGDLDGLLRQWRRLLSLFLFGGARLRPHRAGRYLCPGLPADRRGAALRHPAAAEEDQAHRATSRAEARRWPSNLARPGRPHRRRRFPDAVAGDARSRMAS